MFFFTCILLYIFTLIVCFNKYKIVQNRSNDIWIINDFFSQNEFESIQNYCSKLKLKDDPRDDNRLSLCLDSNVHNQLYQQIYKNKKFIGLINKIKHKSNHILKSIPSFPIEYRKYFEGSNGMQWHKDISLFKPDGFEIVLTLTNNSDSRFQYIENNRLHTIHPHPNTLVIIRPNSVFHRVSKCNYGERTLLKFVIEFTEKYKRSNVKTMHYTTELNNCPF